MTTEHEPPIPNKKQPDSPLAAATQIDDGTPTIIAQYHNAAYNALCSVLWDYVESGKIQIKDEYLLSGSPLKIDMIVIKKKPGVKVKTAWGEIFRKHNIIEYKSPVDTAPNIGVFHKVMGYAYIYAEQNKSDVTDMTATIICHKKPEPLLAALEEKFSYKILRKGRGLYYITNNGIPAEAALGFQIVVVPEAPDADLAALLKAIVKNSDMTVEQKEKLLFNDKSGVLNKSYWADLAFETINKGRMDMGIVELLERKGFLTERDERVQMEAAKKFARYLLNDGKDKEEVARATGLDIADVVMLQCEGT